MEIRQLESSCSNSRNDDLQEAQRNGSMAVPPSHCLSLSIDRKQLLTSVFIPRHTLIVGVLCFHFGPSYVCLSVRQSTLRTSVRRSIHTSFPFDNDSYS